MRETRIIMGMPVTIEIVDPAATQEALDAVFNYFSWVDETFSTYKETSEISAFNAGTIPEDALSAPMKEVLSACAETKAETNGYFDAFHNGICDPSGYVKGWAINHAAEMLLDMGFAHYYVDAGGDMQLSGHNADNVPWIIGIRNPFNRDEIIKRVSLSNVGLATSGTSIRGRHIYNPLTNEAAPAEIVSLTVIAKSVVDADRFATAAFAMGANGISFIATKEGFEGYQIDQSGVATFTPGFTHYITP